MVQLKPTNQLCPNLKLNEDDGNDEGMAYQAETEIAQLRRGRLINISIIIVIVGEIIRRRILDFR